MGLRDLFWSFAALMRRNFVYHVTVNARYRTYCRRNFRCAASPRGNLRRKDTPPWGHSAVTSFRCRDTSQWELFAVCLVAVRKVFMWNSVSIVFFSVSLHGQMATLPREHFNHFFFWRNLFRSEHPTVWLLKKYFSIMYMHDNSRERLKPH